MDELELKTQYISVPNSWQNPKADVITSILKTSAVRFLIMKTEIPDADGKLAVEREECGKQNKMSPEDVAD